MWLERLFSNKKRNTALVILQSLDKKIPCITPGEAKKKLDEKRKDLHDKLLAGNEVLADTEALDSIVDNYIRIQNDKNCAALIEHLSSKNIGSEEEIMEINDTGDRRIVYEYIQARKKEGSYDTKKLIEELESVMQIMERTKYIVSEEDDAEELRRIWIKIINEWQNKLAILHESIINSNNDELEIIKDNISSLSKTSKDLEKYGNDYLSKRALNEFMDIIKKNMPSCEIQFEKFYTDRLGDGMVIELIECMGMENEGKNIKWFIARIIYERLKKGLYVR